MVTIVYSEKGDILTYFAFGDLEGDTLRKLTGTGRDLSKRIFYLLNHQLLSFRVYCHILLPTPQFPMVNRTVIGSFAVIGAAAIAYRLYNINEFKKYSAKKFKAEQEAKQKAEYQKFLAERREKRLPSFLRLIS